MTCVQKIIDNNVIIDGGVSKMIIRDPPSDKPSKPHGIDKQRETFSLNLDI